MPERSKKLGVGIVGAAAIARKNVRAIAHNKSGVEVVAVGSRTISKAEAFIEETGLKGQAKAYGSYEELFDAKDVDAVYMPLPTAIHLQWVRKAAAKGKHILLEKPIALTIEETDEIVKTCKEAGVMLMDGSMFVHNPRQKEVEKVLRDPQAVGDLLTVTSTFTWRAGDDFMANDIRTRKDADAMGCYGDIGWYCIKAALWVYGFEAPILVQAHPGPHTNKNGVVMHGGATIVWKGNRRLVFNCGFTACHSMYLQISGTTGMVEIPDFCIPWSPEVCPYVVKGPAVWHDDDTWIEQDIQERKVKLDRPQETYMWEAFAAAVYNLQEGGKLDESWASQASICNKLCIAVDQSAQDGCKAIDVSKWF